MKEVTQMESVTNFLQLFSDILDSEDVRLDMESPLLSGDTPIDSVALVEICIRLEDYASDLGFDFDWTSENAMSRSRSVFATIGTLYEDFIRQMNAISE